ncbi:hypothetical protein [Lysobacter gummosus]|uniref:hypothetical protein n=1 Tax=Lysobacter gummosus TaxID=262324 RepID=UPI003626F15B
MVRRQAGHGEGQGPSAQEVEGRRGLMTADAAWPGPPHHRCSGRRLRAAFCFSGAVTAPAERTRGA